MSDIKNEIFNLDESSMPDLMRLAEEIPGGFFIYHARGDESIIYANKAMLRIFGCDTMEEFKELTGNTFKGMLYEEDYEQIDKSIWNQIDQSLYDLDYVEYRIKRKDGSIRWIQDYGHYRNTEQYGEVFYVFIEDATERIHKRNEVSAQLQNATSREAQFEKAILNENVAFFEIDITNDTFITSSEQDADGQLRDSFDNLGMPHFTKFSDYVNYCLEYADADEQNKYTEFFDSKRLIKCYEELDIEQSFEGSTVDVLGRKRRYKYLVLLRKNESTGDVIAMLIVKDITEQREKQQLFETAFKQANANSLARKTFLSNISHDIRTPLNSIMCISELVRENDYPHERVEEFMIMIRQSCHQLLNMVMESFNVTRLDAGRSEEVMCNISNIVAFVERQFAPEYTSKKVSLTVNRDSITHSDVIIDRAGIYEIVTHLLDNALKNTETGGSVLLSVNELPCEQDGIGTYQFVVKDNGVGISEKRLGHIRDLFAGNETESVKEVLGDGLGFYIIKNNLDEFGGSIEIQSEPDKGSIFTVTLNCKLQSENQIEETAGHSYDAELLKGKKLLLVEDNRMNMEIEQELLEYNGFVVDTAENGQEALDKIIIKDSDAYDCILMDTRMPVMDGYEAARAIRCMDDEIKANIPIIAVSANVFNDDRKKVQESGMNSLCPKPVDIEYLKTLIAKELFK